MNTWLAFCLVSALALPEQVVARDPAVGLDAALTVSFRKGPAARSGSLFEVYDRDGSVLAGAGIARSDSGGAGRLRFFVGKKEVSAEIDTSEGSTTLRWMLTGERVTILQDGRIKAAFDGVPVLAAPARRIVWGRGAYGLFPGALLSRRSTLDRAFLAAYLHLPRLFASLKTNEQREAAIDAALDRLSASGLNTVMPYATTTSGAAVYPSTIVAERVYGDWDPLRYILAGAKQRDLDVYPVFCVLACGHEKPAGILLEHPDWALRTPEGEPMGHISPANPQAREWVTRVIAEVVERYRPPGILLDYLRYYNRPTRLDPVGDGALHTFQAGRPEAPALEQAFRETELTRLAHGISRAARRIRPDLQIAIYSWGPHVASGHRVAQAWPEWSRDGVIDMVNISGYCYPDNYGDRYLEVFRKRLADAVALNRRVEGRAQVSFCLGVATSHGKIRAASWFDDYLSLGAAQGLTGVALFTWSTAQPYLGEVDEAGYLPKFVAAAQANLRR